MSAYVFGSQGVSSVPSSAAETRSALSVPFLVQAALTVVTLAFWVFIHYTPNADVIAVPVVVHLFACGATVVLFIKHLTVKFTAQIVALVLITLSLVLWMTTPPIGRNVVAMVGMTAVFHGFLIFISVYLSISLRKIERPSPTDETYAFRDTNAL